MTTAAAPGRPAGHPGPARHSRGRPHPAPPGTTVLFGLLISTVLVTSSIIYMFLWTLVVPANGVRMGTVMRACFAKESALQSLPDTAENISRYADAVRRIAECVRPTYLDQISWGVYGTGVLFGVAALIYWAYPLWFVRRRALTPILREDCPELADYLAELSRSAGLDRAPVFLLAPYAATSGGLAFGRVRRRYVQLDAGLVAGYTTDRARFRAVVLHELAHLRNRDVDTTYLTMAIWWSFVALALAPMVAVSVHPLLFRAPLQWRFPGVGSSISFGLVAPVLVGLVYLTRNAILRVRELHADARVTESAADGHEGTSPALRALVNELKPPGRWRAAFGTHPHPRRRIHAIDDPAAMLAPRLWQPFAAGLATAMISVNLRYILLQALPTPAVFATVCTGVICVLGLAGPLVVTVWRAAVHAPDRRVPPRPLLAMAAMLVAGVLLGEQLSWLSIYTQWTQLTSRGAATLLVTTVLLLFGAVTLAVWTSSVARAVLSSATGGPRRALPAVVAGGTAAFAVWFGVWIAWHDTQELLSSGLLDLTALARTGVPGWYLTVTQWVTYANQALLYLIYNSLTLPTLALLWLVPIMVSAHRRRSHVHARPHPYRIGSALACGLAGAALFTAAGAVLVYALKNGVPIAARRDVERFPYLVYANFVALAVAAQAAVALLVSARSLRHRPVLVPLAVMVTGLLSTAVMQLGLNTLSRCVDLYDSRPQPCFRVPDVVFTTNTVHVVMVAGVVAAVPAALLGALVRALLDRLRPPRAKIGHRFHGSRRSAMRDASADVVTLVMVILIVAALLEAPYASSMWIG
ncbi:M48 family metallopeptidase [Sphaerisporangium dianthi]|uniref:M48 family metallopeptidase n=1 Tax=Sphaerisporangium dianthi TaxID=1436120 RepID=A0ABV9CIT6_9ACTN